MLAAALCLGALVQAGAVAIYRSPAADIPSVAYPLTLWLNMPLAKFATTLGFKEQAISGWTPAISSLLLMIGATYLSFRQPYRALKLTMLFFSLSVAFAGMMKFRLDLASQWGAQRYFYPGCVFLLWLICCIPTRRPFQYAAAALVAILEIAALPVIGHTSKMNDDIDQATWLGFGSSGLPVVMPSHPTSWFAFIPASNGGPLAPLNAWVGRNIRDSVAQIASRCSGSMDMIESVTFTNYVFQGLTSPLAKASGTIGIQGTKSVITVALIDKSDTVVGFGAPGFPVSDPGLVRWQGYFSGKQGSQISALAVYSDLSVCRIPGAKTVSDDVRSLSSMRYTGAVALVPGKSLVQAFVPAKRLQGLALQFVTYGQRPDAQTLSWHVRGLFAGDHWLPLGSGTIASDRITDWSVQTLSLEETPAEVASKIEISITTDLTQIPKVPVGIPGFAANPQSQTVGFPATDGDAPMPGLGQFNLKLYYID
jgi:hypothetical protein